MAFIIPQMRQSKADHVARLALSLNDRMGARWPPCGLMAA